MSIEQMDKEKQESFGRTERLFKRMFWGEKPESWGMRRGRYSWEWQVRNVFQGERRVGSNEEHKEFFKSWKWLESGMHVDRVSGWRHVMTDLEKLSPSLVSILDQQKWTDRKLCKKSLFAAMFSDTACFWAITPHGNFLKFYWDIIGI